MSHDWDAIVVGAGAGGGIAAAMLAEAGRRVLLIERGEHRTYADSGRRDHLRNHRLSTYGHNTGPDIEGHPRVLVDHEGRERVLRPHETGYQHNAAAVGSGTLVYGGLAWRFLPDDFRMASRYGVPQGSSLVDWPISYDDLAPWYERAEREIGVSGDGAGNRHQGRRARGYPMPAMPRYATGKVLARGAAALGLGTFPPPILVNSVPYGGRAACIECGSCVGFPCPSDGKNGTQNTVIPRALATGLCTLVTGCTAERVETDERGSVTGVSYIDRDGGRISARAKAVVLSCGAIETARLLLLSSSRLHPNGLGNRHGHVGRNLQGHYYPTAYGLFDEPVYDPRGPGVTIASCDFSHGNDGIVGGGALADDFIMLPIIFWKNALPPGLPRWGAEAKRFMRENYQRVTQVKGPVHEIPNPDCRVELDPNVKDRFGLPVARLSGVVHPETIRAATFLQGKARAWLEASGALRIWSVEPTPRLSAGQHQAGTCRMGSDPRHSVTDPFGRVWDHDNLFVCDGSLHPTNGGFNPALTIMALAFRNGTRLASQM